MSGYDIKKRVNNALAAATHASYGTLYPTLHKLLADGAVEVQEVAQTGRPAKKVYRITSGGRQEFQNWLRQPAVPDQVRREFLLKLYLAGSMPPGDILALITARRRDTELLCRTLETEPGGCPDTPQTWVTDYVLTLCRAEIEWLDRLEQQIGELETMRRSPAPLL